MIVVALVASLVVGYLIGSLNMSVIVGKIKGVDVRKHGSGNAGATNTLRTLGKGAAAIVTAGDLLKSVAAVLFGMLMGRLFAGEDYAVYMYCQYLAGLGAVLGHNYPVYFGFRGGKGILTSFGLVLMLDWRIGLILLVIAILTMAATRFVSLGSVLSAILYPIFVIAFNYSNPKPYIPAYIALSVVVAILALFQHRANIQRLLEGSESKLFDKKKDGGQ